MTVGGPVFGVVARGVRLPALQAGGQERGGERAEDRNEVGGDAAHVGVLSGGTTDADASSLQIGRSREKLKRP